MTVRRPCSPFPFVALACALAAPLAAQQLAGGSGERNPKNKFSIGTNGAHVVLDAPWQRKEITKDVGPDQFVATQGGWLSSGTRTTYAIAREIEAPLENEADYRAALDDSCTLGHDAKIEVTALEGGGVRATRAFRENVDGTACSFRCELLCKDGLAFHFMVWSLESQERTMKARANQIVKAFAFPGPDTDYGKGAVAGTRTVTVAGHVVEYQVRPSVMRAVEASYGKLAEFTSGNELQRLEIAVATPRRSLPDGRIAALLDDERRKLANSAESFVENSRGEIEVDGVRSGFLLCVRDGYVVKSVCIPIGEDSGVILRWHSDGEVAAARPERDACFASIRVKKADAAFALPPVPDRPAYEDQSALSRFLDVGRRVLQPLPMWSASALRNGDAWVAHDWSQVFVEEQGDWRTRHQGSSIRCAAVAKGAIYVLEDGVVRRIDENASEVLPRKSDRVVVRIASGGDSLIALCSAAPVLGIAENAAPLAVVRLASDGTETDLGEVGCSSCDFAAWHEARNELLVASNAYIAPLSLQSDWRTQQLWSKKLDGAASESWGRWDIVRGIVAVADGFLVSGQPEDGVDGVHLVRGPKDREVLLAASTQLMVAVGFDGVELTVTTSRSGAASIVALPIEACRKDGVKCQPFSRTAIEGIGATLLSELGERAPNTKDEVLAARDRADALAAKGHGAPLPRKAADVEALVAAMGVARGLSEDGRVLCAILVAASAIDAGGEWVPAPKASWKSWRSRGATVGDTTLAVFVQPLVQVVIQLDDSEGAMSLVMDVESRGGRALLVGIDADALLARSGSLGPAGLAAALAVCDTKALAAILEASGSAESLRTHVYAVLAGRGRIDAVEELAAPFASKEDAAELDVVAWISARSSKDLDIAQWQVLFARGLAALHEFPGNSNLSVLLGRAAERAFPEEPARARACYERALEISNYGNAADEARKALAK